MDKSSQNNIIIEHKAFKYKIYPNKEQKIMFAKTFGCCRKIWNLMLNDKIAYYQTNKQLLKTTSQKTRKGENSNFNNPQLKLWNCKRETKI